MDSLIMLNPKELSVNNYSPKNGFGICSGAISIEDSYGMVSENYKTISWYGV